MSKWESDLPTECCVCHNSFIRVFINMKTVAKGMEFPICMGCFIIAEVELGPEIGQMYCLATRRKLGG